MSGGFDRLLDSVVRIDVRELNFEEGARRIDASIGSGVILSQDGLILTNAHVAGPEVGRDQRHAGQPGAGGGEARRLGPLDRPVAPQDQPRRREAAGPRVQARRVRRQRQALRGRDRLRGRHAPRAHADGDPRDHLEQQPLLRGHRGRRRVRDRQLQHLAPDRRRDKPGQLRRPARDRGRQGRGDHLARLPRGEQPGLRHPLEHRQARRRGPGARRVDHAQLHRDRAQGAPGPRGLLRRGDEHGRARRQRRGGVARGRRRPAGRRHHPRDQRQEGRRPLSRSSCRRSRT